MNYTPFWFTYNGRIKLPIEGSKALKLYTTSEIQGGTSPLEQEGTVFAKRLLLEVPISDLIWIFPSSYSTSPTKNFLLGDLFRYSFGMATGIHLSRPGLILSGKDIETIKQPASYERAGSAIIRDIDIHLAEEFFELSCFMSEASNEEARIYRQLYEHLYELRCVSPFIGQLGLWSFIEHEWADSPEKTCIHNSLKNLISEAYLNDRLSRTMVTKKIERIGNQLGKKYDETVLRNILAHGKHYTLQEGWTEKEWNEFFEVHEELFRIVSIGLTKKIRTNSFR